MDENSIRILIVDDHPIVRAGLAHQIKASPDLSVVGQASSGEEAIVLARELDPDIVLMDLNMPGIGGHEAALRITAANPHTQVIAVTVSEQEPETRLRRAGIVARVGKTSDTDAIAERIRDVHHHREVYQRLRASSMEDIVNPFDVLSKREFQITQLLLRDKSQQDISALLHITVQTVYNYKHKIFLKLGIKTDLELLKLAQLHNIALD